MNTTDIMQAPHRTLGGHNGWQIDPIITDSFVASITRGADMETAAMIAGVTTRQAVLWYNHGSALLEEYTDGRKEFNDAEQSYIDFARRVRSAEGAYRMTLIDTVSDAAGDNDPKLALKVLERRTSTWGIKESVSVRGSGAVARDPSQPGEITQEQIESKRMERANLIKARMEVVQ